MAAEEGTKRPTGTDGDIAALPEELLFEIFSRVGSVRDIFLFAVTCRRWLRLFTDPAFLRRLCPGQGEGHCARLLGFFSRPTKFVRCERMMKMRMAEHISVSAPTFLPTPGSLFGPTERALTSFVADDDGIFNYAEPLAARCGIVLMELVPRTINHERTKATSYLHLGLCNPTTGERHVAPPTCFEPYGFGGYAIVTAADGRNLDGEHPPSSSVRFAFSQLLLIAYPHHSNDQYLQSYTAATRSWSAPTMCLDTRRFSLVGERSAVVHQGAAHWLCSDYVAKGRGDDEYLYKLSAEVGTTHDVSMAKLPIRAGGSPILCVSRDGKLSVACVYPVHIAVWTQQEGDDNAPAA
ncbi:hypothetical protein BAE44_0010475 [Dichanthelium oligosanthes]|uniref:F-box domain-containing protein n=1 Tax=Dichanthelium oligosanthes TaxID=888268 RepID=A0A1E5VTR4_9POAL|nr:hypothetical protein BAE44_0010475 [Dichanthelium oligosanthes]